MELFSWILSKKILSVLLVTIILLSVTPFSVNAYPISIPCLLDANGECAKWDKYELTYSVESTDKYYNKVIPKAFTLWERYSKLFTFTQVNKTNADIRVKVISDIAVCRNPEALGCTDIRTDTEGRIFFANILLEKDQCVDGILLLCYPISNETKWFTILHEIGHVLGLDHAVDDGKFPQSIMISKINRDMMRITKADIQALYDIYQVTTIQKAFTSSCEELICWYVEHRINSGYYDTIDITLESYNMVNNCAVWKIILPTHNTKEYSMRFAFIADNPDFISLIQYNATSTHSVEFCTSQQTIGAIGGIY